MCGEYSRDLQGVPAIDIVAVQCGVDETVVVKNEGRVLKSLLLAMDL
jgi:hypothetical protein